VAALTNKHPGLEIGLTNTQPPEALELLRTGKIDVAIIFGYDETEPIRKTSACTTCSTRRHVRWVGGHQTGRRARLVRIAPAVDIGSSARVFDPSSRPTMCRWRPNDHHNGA